MFYFLINLNRECFGTCSVVPTICSSISIKAGCMALRQIQTR